MQESALRTTPRPAIGYSRLLLYFLGLGTWGFGGPIAIVGYMQRDLVEERGWPERQELLDGIALGQTMPGPLAAQVAMRVGHLRKGAAGALGTAAAFILPSFVAAIPRRVFAARDTAPAAYSADRADATSRQASSVTPTPRRAVTARDCARRCDSRAGS